MLPLSASVHFISFQEFSRSGVFEILILGSRFFETDHTDTWRDDQHTTHRNR
jgi:hypothetical protein